MFNCFVDLKELIWTKMVREAKEKKGTDWSNQPQAIQNLEAVS